MANIEQLKTLYEQKEFYQALTIINNEIRQLKTLRFSEFKKEIKKVQSAAEFQVLIRLTDHFLMYHYSSFIARYAYRQFPNLLTTSWYCEELLDSGKLLEADELISRILLDIQDQDLDKEEVERIYFCKIRCLLEMKRFKEAEVLLEKVKQSPRDIFDKLGYVYMQIGKRKQAEESFQLGLDSPDKGRICHLLLADLKAATGQIEEAVEIIAKGIVTYPETPAFLLEQIRRFRDLNKSIEMLEIIKDLNELIPDHSYKKYFRHLTGVAYYQLADFDRLKAYLTEEGINKSIFQIKDPHGELLKVNIKPIIQKSNYCVPAGLEMIQSYYGVKTSQDEIARHIFDFTGSRLSTTVDYLEKSGYTCRYFIGTKEHYLTLLKKKIPILLSVDFEHSSHVQVMTGYDSRFDFYHIQDPNMLETLYLTSSELEKANLATSYMSIVFVPNERAEELEFLSCEEDAYFRKLHDLGEKMEEDEEAYKEIFLQFLKANEEVLYTSIYVVKHFSFEEYSDFIYQCAERLLERYPNNDFMNLHVAQAYMRLQKMEQSREQLKSISHKTFSPLFHFLNGRIALYYDDMKAAVNYFRTSLELDPDQYFTWSYLALSYLYSNDVKKAEYFSAISMELASKDRFVRFNHAAVLLEQKEFENARRIYNQLIHEEPEDGHAWYERARLDQKMGKLRKAIRGYLTSVKLESNVPYAYLAAADVYEYDLEDPKRAQDILQTGLKKAESPQLYVRLGDFYRENEDLKNAADCYKTCIDRYPQERFAYIGLAEIIASEESKDKALRFIHQHTAIFDNDSEFLINIGRMIADWSQEDDSPSLMEEAIQLVERGICNIHSNYTEALELYVKMVEETPFVDRAIQFLNHRFSENPEIIEYKCYEGTLFEEKQQFTLAVDCYNMAIQVEESSFPFYRLGEVYFKIERYDLASNVFKRCLALDPQIEPAYLRLAEIASIMQKQEEEAEYLFQLLAFTPLSVNVEYLSSILDDEGLRKLLAKLHELSGRVSEVWWFDAQAYVYGALKNTEKEAECLNSALALEPNHSELQHHQAKCLMKTKKWAKVLPILIDLLNSYPEDEELYRTLILYTAATNNWSRLSNILYGLKGEKEDRSTRFLLAAEAGQNYIANLKWEDEEEGNVFGRFVRKLKNRMKQISLFGAIIELYETAIKIDRNNLSAISHFAKFNENFNLIEDAITILQKALKNHWDDRLAYQLGMNYINIEEFEAALPLFERQLNNDPDDTHLQYLVALIFSEIGDTTEAEARLLRIIEINPYEPNVHFRLGTLFNEQGRFVDAKEILEMGQVYHPFDSDITLELELIYTQIEESKVMSS